MKAQDREEATITYPIVLPLLNSVPMLAGARTRQNCEIGKTLKRENVVKVISSSSLVLFLHTPPFLRQPSFAEMTSEAERAVIQRNVHRIVAESDVKALQAVWQPQDGDENDLFATVDSAVWRILMESVYPVSDRAYAEFTTPRDKQDENENENVIPPPAETWEAWVDDSALERVRQLRLQVRQKALSVQEKRQTVLLQVEQILQEHRQQQSSLLPVLPHPPPLAESVQQSCVAKSQETQQQVSDLIQVMQKLESKVPDVVKRFEETLTTVQAEERQAIGVMGAPTEDESMLAQEEVMDEALKEKTADERLLQYLTMQ